jgi:hypothetical protein
MRGSHQPAPRKSRLAPTSRRPRLCSIWPRPVCHRRGLRARWCPRWPAAAPTRGEGSAPRRRARAAAPAETGSRQEEIVAARQVVSRRERPVRCAQKAELVLVAPISGWLRELRARQLVTEPAMLTRQHDSLWLRAYSRARPGAFRAERSRHLTASARPSTLAGDRTRASSRRAPSPRRGAGRDRVPGQDRVPQRRLAGLPQTRVLATTR